MQAMLQRASALRRAGRVEEAIAAYTELLQREADLPDSWYNLGWLQRQARQFEAALRSYGEALKHGVRGAEEVHLNRAVILSDYLGRPGEAQAELEAALALNPGYIPALLNLGNLNEDIGRRDEARAVYQRILAIEPHNALALSRLAGATLASSAQAPGLIERLQAAIATPNRNAAEQADLGFALGRLLDGRGDYEEAFTIYASANRASRDSLGPNFRGYDRAAHEDFVSRVIASYAGPAVRRGAASPAVFIVGMFRSGSTLVEQMLAGHSGIVSAGELDAVPSLVNHISGYPERAASGDETSVAQWRGAYLEALAPFVREKETVTDKRPDNFLHIGLIKTLFPDAKIVHTRRNRLDNLLSLYFLHLGPEYAYALDLADAAHWYAQYERLMAHCKAIYPGDILDVDYDQLVAAPKPILERLLAFLDLDWEESVLDFQQRSRAIRTASVWQVREPLHARSSGRWRNYEAQLSEALGDDPGA